MNIKKFILKDVRCFEGTQEFNIRPLTFLVGENSTGKSTVLGCMQALGNFARFDRAHDTHFDFNADPYKMGAYADIARKSGEGGGISKSFNLGFEMQINAKITINLLVTLIERESGSEPVIQQIKIEFEDGFVVFEIESQGKTPHAELDLPGVYQLDKSIADNGKPMYTLTAKGEEGLFYMFRYLMFRRSGKKENKLEVEFREFLEKIMSRLSEGHSSDAYSPFQFFPPYRDLRFKSFAPVRSKPKRTYDPVREIEDPEGKNMPMTLMNMHRSNKRGWDEMLQKLAKFGKASGLFANIEIKKHGRSVNDPFQLQVKVNGPKTNIIDVGYGVSQILPILVRIIKAERGTLFLVQQPEVHLHPRGQAELVTLMMEIKNKNKNSFIVETHSDAMINRARIEILNKTLKPKDVSLIYLEPAGNKVDVHNITFDAQANMSNVPKSYRSFFLREYDKLLGFEG